MSADSKETQNQIQQMTQFILNEAKDKSEEITTKALEEFSIEKFKIVNSTKEKIRQEYDRKKKSIDTQGAIARSAAINKSRLEAIKNRNELVNQITAGAKDKVISDLNSESTKKSFYTKLIVQGLLALLESEVEVRCRAVDDKVVESCFADAVKEYSQVISAETGANKTCKLAIDKSVKLPPPPSSADGPSCLGGVMIVCQKATITVDNTIDSRLGLVMEQAKPTIRKTLFPSKIAK